MQINLRFLISMITGFVVGSGTTYIAVHSSVQKADSDRFVPKTMSYYEEHPKEAKARAAYCTDHGILGIGNTPEERDCGVAQRAAFFGK